MKLISFSALAATLLLGGAAQAASLDFVAEAAGDERGVADGTMIDFDGLMVEFNSSDFAYFDDLSSGRPAGLGVCKVLTASDQCDPGNDDNLTAGETVTLSFGQTVELSGFTFYDSDHFSLNTSDHNLLVGLNGAAATETTFAAVVGSVFSNVSSITFAYGVTAPKQYYVGALTATPVPLPAAAPLLIAGMGALAMIRRRRKAA